VMTDRVSLNHGLDGSLYTQEVVPAFQPHTGTLVAAAPSRPPPRYVLTSMVTRLGACRSPSWLL
jgi:hypothetical protein